jgi:hypothetical protein
MWWLAGRARVVNMSSVGASFGTTDKTASEQANLQSKWDMFQWITALIHEAAVLKVFDFDLLGYGVYMNKVAEKLPRGGTNEWFRRQMQYDLAMLCRQVMMLPPESLNIREPCLPILRPYGAHTWMLPPPQALRAIIEKHGWYCKAEQPPLDALPAKALIQGPVMHMDKPPPVEFDMKDTEIIAKLQRGEQLGKGSQEDGLPGAIHGSIGLLYAGIMGVEHCINAKLYSGILAVKDFLEIFLKYSTRLSTLDLSGAGSAMTEEFLTFLPHCGPSLHFLDLEQCNIDGAQVDTLVDTCEALTGLQHLDLAHNKLDGPSATLLLASLAERRVDFESLRLDGNPVGDPSEFRQDIAGLLAARGDQVVAGGELVLYLGLDGVRWFAEPRADTLAARRRDDTLMMAATSFEELIHGAHNRNKALDTIIAERKDPRTRSLKGLEMIGEERSVNTKILSDKMLHFYYNKVVNSPREKVEEPKELDDSVPDTQLEFWMGRCAKGGIRTFTHRDKSLRRCVSCNAAFRGTHAAFYKCKCCGEFPYCQNCDGDIASELIAKEFKKHMMKMKSIAPSLKDE